LIFSTLSVWCRTVLLCRCGSPILMKSCFAHRRTFSIWF